MVMETIHKQYNPGWEYYLAITLTIIATLAVILMALHQLGLL